MSAAAGVAAQVQPRSSNWRSRAAPSACVARQPNCWMKKLGIWNRSIEPKTTYAGFAEYTESTEKKRLDRKSTRLNSSHVSISYAVFCLKKKKKKKN